MDLQLLKNQELYKGIIEKYAPSGGYCRNANIDSVIETIEAMKQSDICKDKDAADELIELLISIKKQ